MQRLHPVLFESAAAARTAQYDARRRYQKAELAETVAMGADGTATMRIDEIVERAILDVAARHRVNVLSEEVGFVDHGSAYTTVLDPLDGSANAAADVPLSCFSAAIAEDDRLSQALTVWMESDRQWGGRCDGTDLVGGPWKITGRTVIDGGALSLLRPHPHTKEQWWSVASRAARVRILSCSTLESVLVLQGSTDAICDAAEAIPDIDALYLQAKGYCPAGSPKCGPGALNGTQSGSWKAQTNDDWMAPIAAACKLSGAPSSCRPAKK